MATNNKEINREFKKFINDSVNGKKHQKEIEQYLLNCDQDWFMSDGIKIVVKKFIFEITPDIWYNYVDGFSKHSISMHPMMRTIFELLEITVNHLLVMRYKWTKNELDGTFQFLFKLVQMINTKNCDSASLILYIKENMLWNTLLIAYDMLALFALFSILSKDNIIEKYLSIHSNIERNLVQHKIIKKLEIVCEFFSGSIKEILNEIDLKSTIDFLRSGINSIISKETNNGKILEAILAIERLHFCQELNDVQVLELRQILEKRIKLWNSNTIPNEYRADAMQLQLTFCVGWFCKNVLYKSSEERLTRQPLIKIMNDFFVRNDRATSVPVCSVYPIKSGIHYYEAIPITKGSMHFGWTNRLKKLTVRECSPEVAIQVIQTDFQQNVKNNVVGCLLDLNEHLSIFYLNGVETYRETVDSHPQAYYAAASLSAFQQCYFNFGQKTFYFLPKEIKNSVINSSNARKNNRLLEPNRNVLSSQFWFKHDVLDHKIETLFQDRIQLNYDKFVQEIKDENFVADNSNNDKFDNQTVDNDCQNFRLIQSILNIDSRNASCEQIDFLGDFVGMLISDLDKQLNDAKFYELIYPYLQLKVTNGCQQHHNICLVLSSVIKYSNIVQYSILSPIRREIFEYLIETFCKTICPVLQIFLLSCLEELKMDEREKVLLEKNVHSLLEWTKITFEKSSDTIGEKNTYKILCNKSSDEPTNDVYAKYQCYFGSQRLLRVCFGKDADRPIDDKLNDSKLNPSDRTKHLKLSLDQLSARSDWKWQSVRSLCCCNSNKYIYFYEAILLTNGLARFGWAIKETNFDDESKVGDDENSIGFDGCSRCIWHDLVGIQYQAETVPKWKAGDVIGCLIDLTNPTSENKFRFLLNGQNIYSSSSSVYFSPNQPYHPAISLGQHQHCYLNFGQSQFKHKPKRVEVNDFYFKSIQVPTTANSQVNLTGSTIGNNFITVAYRDNTISGVNLSNVSQ